MEAANPNRDLVFFDKTFSADYSLFPLLPEAILQHNTSKLAFVRCTFQAGAFDSLMSVFNSWQGDPRNMIDMITLNLDNTAIEAREFVDALSANRNLAPNLQLKRLELSGYSAGESFEIQGEERPDLVELFMGIDHRISGFNDGIPCSYPPEQLEEAVHSTSQRISALLKLEQPCDSPQTISFEEAFDPQSRQREK